MEKSGVIVVTVDRPTAKDIWDTLSRINVEEHIEVKLVKGVKLSYLSWAWAWGVMMENFPEAQYRLMGEETFPDCTVKYKESGGNWVSNSGRTVMTGIEISIGEVRRAMWLPVMDNRNLSMIDPDARSISDSRMRCLVKAMAMFGLGHYIYAGEDLPMPEDATHVSGAAPVVPGSAVGTPGSAVGTPRSAVGTPRSAVGTVVEMSDEKARVIYDTMIAFSEGAKTIQSLEKFWTDNRDELASLKSGRPEMFQALVKAFSSVKDAIKAFK